VDMDVGVLVSVGVCVMVCDLECVLVDLRHCLHVARHPISEAMMRSAHR
jgi:hypothetical protein